MRTDRKGRRVSDLAGPAAPSFGPRPAPPPASLPGGWEGVGWTQPDAMQPWRPVYRNACFEPPVTAIDRGDWVSVTQGCGRVFGTGRTVREALDAMWRRA